MCIDQPWDDQFALYIDYFIISIHRQESSGFVNGNYAITLDGDSPIADDVTSGIHCDDSGILEKHLDLPLLPVVHTGVYPLGPACPHLAQLIR